MQGPPGPCGCGCALTPETSYGFDVILFARDVLLEPLDPWEQWLVIHAGELLSDGRPRFRYVLVLVARQNGKTHTLKVLSLYWQFVEEWPLVVGTSTNLDNAKDVWEMAVANAESTEQLHARLKKDRSNGIRRSNGEQCMTSIDTNGRECRYKIATSDRKGGRGKSIDRLIMDELREHHDWSAWNAATKAMNARPFGQAFAITNQGDEKSVVLDAHWKSCLKFIETGDGDYRFGLFEWSAPEGCEVDDPEGWEYANPNLGYRMDEETISGDSARAKAAGGEELAGFRTEVLCQRVLLLNPAIDQKLWESCGADNLEDWSTVRGRVAFCLDVSLDQRHATLAAAAVQADGRVRVHVVDSWDSTQAVKVALGGVLTKAKPRTLGWFPNGPAASLATELRKRPGFPGPGIKVDEIRKDADAVCMGFVDLIVTGQLVHGNDPLLNEHVKFVEKKKTGDTWRFTRAGDGHCDASYAAAGAVHLARSLPNAPELMDLIMSD